MTLDIFLRSNGPLRPEKVHEGFQVGAGYPGLDCLGCVIWKPGFLMREGQSGCARYRTDSDRWMGRAVGTSSLELEGSSSE